MTFRGSLFYYTRRKSRELQDQHQKAENDGDEDQQSKPQSDAKRVLATSRIVLGVDSNSIGGFIRDSELHGFFTLVAHLEALARSRQTKSTVRSPAVSSL